eukprot:TRINITY_DN7756_c0_g2_i1.p1 TRINITY_DN7756_c0_g2~~TRINITY_DN7756_c0_g2_i1.p1  ORF type:complete len:275 (+),score=35.54 TRINITY_DN7756_c0_g2_i1:55-879(+)
MSRSVDRSSHGVDSATGFDAVPHDETGSSSGYAGISENQSGAAEAEDEDTEFRLCIRNTFLDYEVVHSTGQYRRRSWSNGDSSCRSFEEGLFLGSSSMQSEDHQRASATVVGSPVRQTETGGTSSAAESGHGTLKLQPDDASSHEESDTEPEEQSGGSEGGEESDKICPLCRRDHDKCTRPSSRRRMALKKRAHEIVALPDSEEKLNLVRSFLASAAGTFACKILAEELSDEMLSIMMRPENDPRMVDLTPARPGLIREGSTAASSSNDFRVSL